MLFEDWLASTVKAYFGYYQKTLDMELCKLRENNTYFKEEEVWFIFYSIVKVCAYLQEAGMFHSDLRPQNILLNERGGIYLAPYRFLP